MSTRRAVITGMGALCSLGNSVQDFWDGITAGRSGISRIEKLDLEGLAVTIAGEIKGFDPVEHGIDKRYARRIDLVCQYALAAASQAIAESGFSEHYSDRGRLGCIIGSGVGGLTTIQEETTKLVNKGPGRISPFLIPKMMINSISGEISISHGLQGQNYMVVSACASAGHAIGLAQQAIASGACDVVVTGGSEAAVTHLGMGGFANMKALSRRNDEPERASRPFDKDRDGFVMGEGAGILVLEEYEAAKARGATIYAEVKGSANNADASHITLPNPEGGVAAKAMSMALEDAGVTPDQVDYVNAHGTSTPANDPTETKAIKTAFGDHASKLAISSTKSMIGHLLGASGALEAIAVALSIHRGVVHPTANHETPDPECDLDYVPGASRELTVRNAISNSFGFGGHNVTVVLGQHE